MKQFPEEVFVDFVKSYVRKNAYDSMRLELSEGAPYIPDLRSIAAKYQAMSEQEKAELDLLVRHSVHVTIFRFLYALSGGVAVPECNHASPDDAEDYPGWYAVCAVDGVTEELAVVSDSKDNSKISAFIELYSTIDDDFLRKS